MDKALAIVGKTEQGKIIKQGIIDFLVSYEEELCNVDYKLGYRNAYAELLERLNDNK